MSASTSHLRSRRLHANGPAAVRRLFAIHEHFVSGGRVTVSSLAEKLEVSVRTIKRDIEALRHEHGAQIVWEPSTGTYFCERPSEHLPLLRITADEAIAVALANSTFAAWGGSPLGRALNSALVKIADVVGNAVSIPMEGLTDCIFRPDDTSLGDRTRHHFARLLEAIRRKRALRIAYRKPGESQSQERNVNPLHLAFLDHEWMLVAFDTNRGALRNFLLTRIEAVHTSARSFEPPAGFDPKRHLAGAFGRYTGGPLQDVLIHFDAFAAPYIRERKWHLSQHLRELPGGGVEVNLRVNHLLDVQRWVLSWGSHAEAIAPEELRENIAQELRALAVRYPQIIQRGQPVRHPVSHR